MKKVAIRSFAVATVLVVFLCVFLCMKTVPASAASEAEAHFAQVQAKERWNNAKEYWSDAVYFGGQEISEANGNATGKLSDLTYVSGASADSTYTFQNGVLTLSGAGETIVIAGSGNSAGISSDGALWVVYDNISTNGKIRPFMGWTVKYPTYDMPLIVSSPIDENFNVLTPNGSENAGGMITQTTSANNLIRNSGTLIILGDVGFSAGVSASSASGDSIASMNDNVEHVCILAPGRDSTVTCVEKPYHDSNGRAIRCGTKGTLYLFGSIFDDTPVSIVMPNWINASSGVILDDGADLTLSGTYSCIDATSGGITLKNGAKLVIDTTLESPLEVPEGGLTVDETSTLFYTGLIDSAYTHTFPVAGVYNINGTAFSVEAGAIVSSSEPLSVERISSENLSALPSLPVWYGEIETTSDLDAVRNHLDGYYVLKNDITFSSSEFVDGGAFYNDGACWAPIGATETEPFTGTFDGNGYSIASLRIKETSSEAVVGLFGYVDGGVVRNLNLTKSYIRVSADLVRAGGIAGISEEGTIENCTNSGSLVFVDSGGFGSATFTDLHQGSVSYDTAANTFTLYGITATRSSFALTCDVVVVLEGENQVGSNALSGKAFVSFSPNLKIIGSGSLNVTAKENVISSSYNFEFAGGTVSVVSESKGMIIEGTLSVTGGVLDVTAQQTAVICNAASFSAGTSNIFSSDGSAVIGNDIVSVCGEDTEVNLYAGKGYAVYAAALSIAEGTVNTCRSEEDGSASLSQQGFVATDGNITFTSATVCLKVLGSNVIHADNGYVAISGSSVVAYGDSYGIFADYNVEISDSVVEISITGEYGVYGQNISVDNSSVTISAAKNGIYCTENYTQTSGSVSLDVQSGTGIRTVGSIDISGGTVKITGHSNGALYAAKSSTISSEAGTLTYVDIEAYANAIYGITVALTISGEEYDEAAQTGTYLKIVSELDHGIRMKDVNIQGGTLDISAMSNAIRAAQTLTISDGNVTATNLGSYDKALYAVNIEMFGGTVTASAAKNVIYATEGFTQAGGALTVISNGSAFYFGTELSFLVGSVDVRLNGTSGTMFAGSGTEITLSPNVEMTVDSVQPIDIGTYTVKDENVVYADGVGFGDQNVTHLETVTETKIVRIGEKYYYLVGTKRTDMGLFRHTDGNYYVAQYDGSLIVGKKYYVWKVHESASEISTGWYYFDEYGKLYQGILGNPDKDGALCYYVNGKPTEKGLFKLGDDYYCSQYDGTLITNKKYYVWKLDESASDIPKNWYYFDEEGKLYQGIQSNPDKDGALYYYVNGKPTEMGLFKDGDDYYYSQYNGALIVGKKYYVWKVHESASDVPKNWYYFDEEGRLYQGIQSNPDKDGALYYYVNGKPTEMGLFKDGDDYYCAQYNGALIVDKKYYVWKIDESASDISIGWYYFDSDGKLYQGIQANPDKDGALYYYVNGKPTEMGLFKDGEDYYYAQYDGSLIVNKDYYAWKVADGCDLGKGTYSFDADGKMYRGSAASPDSGSYGRYDSSVEHKFLATDILTHGIVVYDLDACSGDFQNLKDDSVAIIWEWDPEKDPNLTTKGPLVGIDSAKYRYSEYYGKDVIVACSSNGWVGIIDYEACSLIWEYQLVSGPHSVELLPNGDLVVASSFDPGALYYFPLSAGINEPVHSIESIYCHGVSWDPENNCLWVLEHYGVYAAVIENMGTKYGKIVRLDQCESLFGNKISGGHAFSPILGSPGKYWASSGTALWQFDSATGELTCDYFMSDFINRGSVKGVCSFEDGTVIEAIAGLGDNLKTWSSAGFRIVTRDPSTGRILFETVLFETRDFYKIQPFTKNYQ